MIAYLKGIVQWLEPTKKTVIVVVQDVGYKVTVPASVLSQCKVGETVAIYTYQHVREDALELFGFAQMPDLHMFEKLITVSGVGPKAGMSLLSQYSAQELARGIMSGDTAMLTQVSGIGKKIAERLVLELKQAFTDDAVLENMSGGTTGEVVSALQALGYSSSEIRSVAQNLDHAASVQQQLKQALALLSRHS